MASRTGKCLCGKVTFEAELKATHYHACHCSICRRWGGPALAVEASSVQMAEDAAIGVFESSDYGERVFCTECGSHLFWRMKDRSMTVVWVGAIENADDLAMSTQIFVDEKPSHYSFANDTSMLTGAQFVAAISQT